MFSFNVNFNQSTVDFFGLFDEHCLEAVLCSTHRLVFRFHYYTCIRKEIIFASTAVWIAVCRTADNNLTYTIIFCLIRNRVSKCIPSLFMIEKRSTGSQKRKTSLGLLPMHFRPRKCHRPILSKNFSLP